VQAMDSNQPPDQNSGQQSLNIQSKEEQENVSFYVRIDLIKVQFC
jgi:hypothetical protein